MRDFWQGFTDTYHYCLGLISIDKEEHVTLSYLLGISCFVLLCLIALFLLAILFFNTLSTL